MKVQFPAVTSEPLNAPRFGADADPRIQKPPTVKPMQKGTCHASPSFHFDVNIAACIKLFHSELVKEIEAEGIDRLSAER
jgi:hypothetical protein